MGREAICGGRFAAPRPPEGLEGDPGALPLLGLTLHERQDRALILGGARPAEEEHPETARVLVREDAAITHHAVADLIAAGRAAGRDLTWRTGGRSGGFADEIAFGRDEPLLVWLQPGGAATPERIAAAQTHTFDPQERLIELPLPGSQFEAELLELPLTERLVLPASHWLQLLWANLLGLAPMLWRELVGRNFVEALWRLFWAAVRAGSLRPLRIGAELGRRGKRCRVHPTAVVERCWLGDDVEIGAGAVVRASVLADGSAVEPLAVVEGSVLAAGARVQRQALFKFSVLGEKAMAAGGIQLSVLDRECAVKYHALLMDQALRQTVRVSAGGALVDAPLGLAGVCIGARTLIAAQAMVAPGRAVPPDLRVIPDPRAVLRKIPAGASGVMAIRDGTLETP